jgi:SAM-dependent methyltransferase
MPPMPPPRLRFKVAGHYDEGLFDSSGRRSIEDISRALAGVGRRLSDFPRILEWGCGCGRILRHLSAPGQEVHGCDIDGEAVEWLGRTFPDLHVAAIDGLPPTPYPDAHFDLIINHSVLSHLSEDYQDAWLAELRRILKPEGVLILTVLGPQAYDGWVSQLPHDREDLIEAAKESRRALQREGIYFFVDNGWAEHFPDYYQSTFHAPWYVFQHWSEFFSVLSYISEGSLKHQDMIVLRQRDRSASLQGEGDAGRISPSRAPVRAPAYELEIEALTRKAAILAAEKAELAATLTAVRNSTSWKVTGPLRAAIDRLRGTGRA